MNVACVLLCSSLQWPTGCSLLINRLMFDRQTLSAHLGQIRSGQVALEGRGGHQVLFTLRVEVSAAFCIRRFTVRVMVPCYAEPLSVVSATVTAAMEADLPPGAAWPVLHMNPMLSSTATHQ